MRKFSTLVLIALVLCVTLVGCAPSPPVQGGTTGQTPRVTLPPESYTEMLLGESGLHKDGVALEDLPEPVQRFHAYKAQNQDCVGYLYIPGTKIDYPVLHRQNDNGYYLFLNINQHLSIFGSIFLDGASSSSPRSTNWLLHGHNMINGDMFAGLLKYKKEAYFKENPYIYLATEEEVEIYEIFSCYTTQVRKSKEIGFRYYQFIDPATEEEFSAGIAQMKQSGLYDTGVTPEFGDTLLTLSTCEYSSFNGRMVVVARRIKSEELQKP